MKGLAGRLQAILDDRVAALDRRSRAGGAVSRAEVERAIRTQEAINRLRDLAR